jgi:4-hydroxymandelate oxidase
MAAQGMMHREGEVAMARAALGTESIMCLSTFASTSVLALAQAVPEAARWFQLYVFKDRGISQELLSQAGENGYEAVVVTVDLPVLGIRERELRSPMEGHVPAAQGALGAAQFAALVDEDLNWSDIERLVADSKLPVLVKGILTAEDGRLAAEHGVAGVVVSNHGGRQLDTVVSTADALPEVVEAVGDRLDVLVDGGIRRGTDVLKALALGANAVMVGRPVLCGLAAGGAEGARHVLELLLGEFDTALALAGSPRARDLAPTFVMSQA